MIKLTAFPENMVLNPRELEDLGLIRDFTQKETGVTTDFSSVTLVNENFERLLTWIYDEYGRFENPPARLEMTSGQVYEYYLNLGGESFTHTDYDATVGIEPRKGNTQFFDQARGTTFELLRSKGFLPDSLMVQIPYIIQQDNVQLQAVVLLSTGITLTLNLYNLIKETAYLVADALDVVGTGLLTAIAKAIVFAIWIALTVVAIIQAAKSLKELLFPKIRYFKAISDYNLIRRGVEYLGYTLESSFLESIKQIHTLPIPESESHPSVFNFLQDEITTVFNDGYPKAGDTTPTLLSLINHYLDGYNMEIFVNNGVVKIEHESTLMDTANVYIKPTFSNQEERTMEYRYNDEDVFGRKYLYWQVDYTDTHSPDNFKGLRAEYITVPITTLNPDLVNITNLKEVPLDFAWMARKNSLTKPEKLAKNLLSALDGLINAFGGNSSLASNIDERIGIGMISSQYFSKTKKLFLQHGSGKQTLNYFIDLSADNIFENWHKIRNVKEYCKKIPTDMTVPFTEDNFNALLSNYYVNLPDNTKAKVLYIDYKDRQHKAVIRYAIPDSSGFNVKTIKLA